MCIVKQLRKSFYILLFFLICNLLGVILFYFYDYAIDHLWHNVFGISKGARGFITIFITGVMSLFDLVIAAGFLVPAVFGYYCLLFNLKIWNQSLYPNKIITNFTPFSFFLMYNILGKYSFLLLRELCSRFFLTSIVIK